MGPIVLMMLGGGAVSAGLSLKYHYPNVARDEANCADDGMMFFCFVVFGCTLSTTWWARYIIPIVLIDVVVFEVQLGLHIVCRSKR